MTCKRHRQNAICAYCTKCTKCEAHTCGCNQLNEVSSRYFGEQYPELKSPSGDRKVHKELFSFARQVEYTGENR